MPAVKSNNDCGHRSRVGGVLAPVAPSSLAGPTGSCQCRGAWHGRTEIGDPMHRRARPRATGPEAIRSWAARPRTSATYFTARPRNWGFGRGQPLNCCRSSCHAFVSVSVSSSVCMSLTRSLPSLFRLFQVDEECHIFQGACIFWVSLFQKEAALPFSSSLDPWHAFSCAITTWGSLCI